MVTGLFHYLQAYPALYAIIGSTTLPNYKGMFLRGYGSQAYSQSNGSTIGTTTTTHASGSLGAVQGDAIRDIEGSDLIATLSSAVSVTPTGAFYRVVTSTTYVADKSSGRYTTGGYGVSASRVVPTANENRPANVAVNYIIKAY